MIGQLHAGIVWQHLACWDSILASLAFDWVTACWDSLTTLECWDSLSSLPVCDWLLTNGCFNPIGVNSIIA